MIRGKRYIYHVYDQDSGHEIACGTADECGERIGLSKNTIRRMANGHTERRSYDMRDCYYVTAELDDSPKFELNRYIVRLSRTGQIVADGTAEECAEQLGMRNASHFYQLVTYVRSAVHKTKYEIDIFNKRKD